MEKGLTWTPDTEAHVWYEVTHHLLDISGDSPTVSFGMSNAVAYRYTGTMSRADTVHAVRQTNFAMNGVRYRGDEIGWQTAM